MKKVVVFSLLLANLVSGSMSGMGGFGFPGGFPQGGSTGGSSSTGSTGSTTPPSSGSSSTGSATNPPASAPKSHKKATTPKAPAAPKSLSLPAGSYTQACSGCTATDLGNGIVSLQCSCLTANQTTVKASALIPEKLFSQISGISDNKDGQLAITYKTLPNVVYLYGQVQ